jgi:uncharacterized protein YozE (UPF0346 family)/DNA invertase Pin-like site-specific DNA recombinase
MEDNLISSSFDTTSVAPDKEPPTGVLTLEQLVQLCVRLQPAEAAARGDSALCVTPLITHLIVDSKVVELCLRGGRWGAGYTRVSGEVQRAAASADTKVVKKVRHRKSTQQVVDGQGTGRPAKAAGAADGYSEEEQLTRQIRHFVRVGLAFKLYSDCGLTGEYPCNDPRLIKRLLSGKAARYKKIYERTLLDETSLLRRTPEEIASMHAYLARRVATIQDGLVTDDEFADDGETSGSRARSPGRPRNKVFFRQAFTQLWRDIEADCVHEVAVSDRSRLCRSADLESEFLVILHLHKTRLVGLIEDLSTLDVSDPLRKGYAYLIASVNEYRLEETAGHSFRGLLQLLESGHPHGRPPWWLVRDAESKAVEMPEYARYARRVAELFLAGLGVAAITTRLHSEGILVGGQPLTTRMVRYVLENEAVEGRHLQFGLVWDLYPRLLSEETVREIRERRLARRDMLIPQFGERIPNNTSANHLFTGLLRCACGRLLKYSHPDRKRGKTVGYYYCSARHKSSPGEEPHAWMSEAKLAAFLSELLGERPDLIAAAVGGCGDRAAKAAAQRSLLEERLGQVRANYALKESGARERAAATAVATGIGTESAYYASVVTEISRGLLEAERAALASLEEELVCLSAGASQDQQASRVLEVVGQLRCGLHLGEAGADAMDIRTQNSLLKAIFSEITMYSLEPKCRDKTRVARQRRSLSVMDGGENVMDGAETEGGTRPRGCFVMQLTGIETPLPPVRIRRGFRKEFRLPTVAEWVTDVFALAPVEEYPLAAMDSWARRAFYSVLAAVRDDTPVGRLAAALRADKTFPRRAKGRETIGAYLAGEAHYDEVREHLDTAWAYYLEAERQRVLAGLDGHGRPVGGG